MAESPTQHRQLAPGPSQQSERSSGDSPTEERRGSVDSTKKRCSGERPCDNCRAFNRECIFDETLDQRRRVAARRTADELNYHRDLFNDLLTVLRAEDRSYALRLLELIRRNATNEELRIYIDQILVIIGEKGGESEQAVRKLEGIRSAMSEGATQSWRPQVMDIHYLCDDVPYRVPAQPWTNVTSDSDLVSHLVSLYFTWDYPFHAFLDRDVFLKHMASGDLKSEFCCPFLVNALLANACHFSDYSEAYARPGDAITKGADFLTEAERLRDQEPARLTLTYLQGLLLLYEKYSLSGKNDLGYKMLHKAIWIGENLGLVGERKPNLVDGGFSEDMDASLRRTAWGLFHIDTLIHHVNLERPDRHDQGAFWWPYPTHRAPQNSYLSEYFEKSYSLCEIAHDMSQHLFAIGSKELATRERIRIKDALYERLRRWVAELPASFAIEQGPPPYVLTMRMRYYTLIINLLLYHAEDEILGAVPEAMNLPESPTSPTSPSYLLVYSKRNVTESAARAIAVLACQHRRDFGMAHAHHFAVYAVNLALFVLVEQHSTFDILDSDFLSLASAYSSIASRSHLGRNMFHLFRQNVRAKCQGSRLRDSTAVTEEIKMLFDEECTSPSVFDGFADGLEKLDADVRYRVLGEHRLSDMLDRYETLSLGKDEIARGRFVTTTMTCLQCVVHDIMCTFRHNIPNFMAPWMSQFFMGNTYRSDRPSFSSATNQNVEGLSPNPAIATSPADWTWRDGGLGATAAAVANNPAAMNYQLYPFGQYPDLNMTVPPQPDRKSAPKIPIPRATSVKASSQRRRSARACEPCRQRKVKCDGGRPVCRKCREHDVGCSYIDIKRIRDQKQLGALSEKVDRYEKLLRQFEIESDPVTARRVKKALAAFEHTQADDPDDPDTSDAESTSSHGSLEDIDLVKEDLNRSDKAVAIGFFGKNSEVAWMQKLEDLWHQSESDGDKSNKSASIMSMSYHLDDLAIPFPESVDPFAVPEKELADQYFNAYMESVHPAFTVIRKNTFTTQYEQFSKKRNFSPPPRKWLAVLNMIFALGCRYCKLTGQVAVGEVDTDDTEFLNRARKLCLSGNVLFEHDDLQQIQVMLLVAFYLVALGQVNGASKFSSMALRSAISLGINLRFKDDKTHYASKEARTRLWWSIFLLEHLVTSITGRISGCDEGLSAALLPVPFDEEGAECNPGFSEPSSNSSLQVSCLQLTLFQTEDEAQSAAAWVSNREPSPTLLFHCLVDLNVIAQTIINNVYSLQGLRESSVQFEQRLQKYSQKLDTWLRKVPISYRFAISQEDDTYLSPRKGGAATKFARERIILAIYYYSARITLCRPCLSHTPTPLHKASNFSSRANFRAMTTLACLRAAISLLSILPENPDIAWLTTITPWWATLHFIMQATTALLIGLSTRPANETETNTTPQNKNAYLPTLDRHTMVSETQKALRWLHHLGFSSRAARRAFILCERFLSRMGPSLGLTVDELPSSEAFPPVGDVNMVGPEELSGFANEGYALHADGLTVDGLAMVDD
ncbi:fungal-specific transcription factor domain-containing protein [Aspergillus varians]